MKFLRKSLKIIQEHGIKILLYRIGVAILNYRRKYYVRSKLGKSNSEEIFNAIHKVNYWRSSESSSGPGSELRKTKNLREQLPKLIQNLKIKKIIDAPCGDCNWMNLIIKDINVEYLGIDIVEAIIEINKKNNKFENVSFRKGNICQDPFLKADLLIVRDCLFHLSYNDIAQFLDNFSKSDIKFLLTTTHINTSGNFNNIDILTGDFRKIDLFTTPFNFKRECVQFQIDDYCGNDYPRMLILVSKENTPTTLSFE